MMLGRVESSFGRKSPKAISPRWQALLGKTSAAYSIRCRHARFLKIMAIVDRHGLPLAVSTHAANHHEVRLVQLCFDFYMVEAKPENLIGDRAYDSDPLDHALRQDGIEMIAPHRSNRTKPPTQDRRRLRRFLRRWLVERFFAWIQWQRRILVRWEYHPENFLGFVQLACLVVLFRRF